MDLVMFGLDILLALLLLVFVILAALLYRRLGHLRAGRAELEQTVQQFDQATARAEAALRNLKAATDQAGNQLKDPVEKAQSLHDELVFLVERGDRLAARLAGGDPITAAGAGPGDRFPAERGPGGAGAVGGLTDASGDGVTERDVPRAGSGGDADGGEARSRAERDLLKALKGIR